MSIFISLQNPVDYTFFDDPVLLIGLCRGQPLVWCNVGGSSFFFLIKIHLLLMCYLEQYLTTPTTHKIKMQMFIVIFS